MSKEMTPLKALNNIKLKLMRSYDNSFGCNGNVMFEKELPIIEKALKENERLKASYNENLLNEESKEYIYKELKALEIIKDLFEVWEDNGTYHIRPLFDIVRITKEEYDLLKEVLL